jgi:hypothetical protein
MIQYATASSDSTAPTATRETSMRRSSACRSSRILSTAAA